MKWLFCLLFVLELFGSETKTLDLKIQSQRRELETLKSQIEEGSRRLEQLNMEQSQARERLQAGNRELEQLSAQISETQSKRESLALELSAITSRLTSTQASFSSYEVAFYSRLAHLYKNRNLPYLKIVLNAESIADFSRRLVYYKAILEEDSGFFLSLRENRRQIARQKAEIEERDQQKNILDRKLELDKITLLARIENDTVFLKKIHDEQETLQKTAEKLNESSQYLKDKIQSLMQSREQLKKVETVKPGESVETKPEHSRKIEKNSLLWPLANFNIQRGYGSTKGDSNSLFNPGIDLETTGEKAVLASEDGVIFYRGSPAGNSSTYGKVIMIAHGDCDGKFITLYGNLSSILVAQNQTIRKGEKIATIAGSEGESSRLHFQVRVNGEPQDPSGWLEQKKSR